MPSHNHTLPNTYIFIYGSLGWKAAGNIVVPGAPNGGTTGWYTINGSNISSSYTGSSQPHENRPPYYALCYIMKL